MNEAKLASVFAYYPNIQAVYLFGSQAEATARADSDVDLAILPRPHSIRPNKLNLLADLAQAGFCNVDVAFLDTDDIVLKHEAVRLNRLIYATPDFERGATHSRIIREYLDFKPFLDLQRKAYKQRILNAKARSDTPKIAEAG